LVNVPETLYAETSGGRVAYQVVGPGPPDVLATKPPVLAADLMWDEPRLARFLNGLSSFSRHIWFDPRGTGSSDPIAPVVEPALSRRVLSFAKTMRAKRDQLQGGGADLGEWP
jgi:hypothetical protein